MRHPGESLVACLLAAVSLPAAARAQEATPAPLSSQPAASAEPAEEPLFDVIDLLRAIREKPAPPPESASGPPPRMWAISPVIGAKPTAGVSFGVAGNLAFYGGDPATTHISSAIGSMTISTKSQTSITLRSTAFLRDDAWRLEGDDRLQWTSQEMFGLGIPTPLEDAERVKFDFVRLHQSLYGRVRQNLFLGGGFHFDRHADIKPVEGAEDAWPTSPFVTYSTANGLPLDAQSSAGISAEAIWDSRDSFINPARGWLARASYRWLFDDFLGADSSWGKLNIDVRTYAALTPTRRHRLASWFYADMVVDGVVPYFELPSTGSDTYGRSGRGYAEGHFRGQKLAFVELEYRGTLMRNGLLGMVAFVNATTVADSQRGQALFDAVVPGGGAGLRLLINKRSRTNLAFDVGFGEKGSRGIYLSVQEAF